MKKTLSLIVAILICLFGKAQQFIPSERSEFTFFKKEKVNSLKQSIIELNIKTLQLKSRTDSVKNSNLIMFQKGPFSNLDSLKYDKNNLGMQIDSLNATALADSIKKMSDLIEELSDDNYIVQFFAGASINSSDGAKDLGATSRVSATIKLADKLRFNLGYNVRGVKPQGISKDSLDLISLMFPEASSTGYLMSISYDFFKEDKSKMKRHNLSPYAEFAFKQSKVESPIIDSAGVEVGKTILDFSSLNYNIGLQYSFTYEPKDKPENTVNLTLQAYINFFNIPNEDEDKFYELVNDKLDNSNITSLGIKSTLSYKDFTVFGDFRNNFSTKNLRNDNVFKGFVFNIGTMINTRLLKL